MKNIGQIKFTILLLNLNIFAPPQMYTVYTGVIMRMYPSPDVFFGEKKNKKENLLDIIIYEKNI